MPETKPDPTELSLYGVEEPPVEKAPKKPLRENRPVPPPPPEEGPELWFACRVKEDCPGRKARLLLRVKKPGGGALLRYRCLTCNKTYSIST